MRTITQFSSNVINAFGGQLDNITEFNHILLNASRGIYENYSKEETNKIIRAQFDKILGINWNETTPMKRRQSWREHKYEFYTVIEDVVADRMVSGWGDDPFFMQFVDERNLALGDTNEFYVEDDSLMQVSKFAGNHHDIIRQKVGFGKSFNVETSWYAIKCYNDFELFRSGKIDFSKMVDKMYTSIDKHRKDAIYTAFMSAEEVLPTDLVVDVNLADEGAKDDIVAIAEEVKSVTGKDVAFVGTKVALSKLQKLVPYALWSDKMKDELHTTGELGNLEGYTLLTVPRVNEMNSRKEVTDNTKILIVPIDPEFKPIKLVNEGDVAFYEAGMDGSKKDMTIEAELAYKEGVAVVINQLYGVINIG